MAFITAQGRCEVSANDVRCGEMSDTKDGYNLGNTAMETTTLAERTCETTTLKTKNALRNTALILKNVIRVTTRITIG